MTTTIKIDNIIKMTLTKANKMNNKLLVNNSLLYFLYLLQSLFYYYIQINYIYMHSKMSIIILNFHNTQQRPS